MAVWFVPGTRTATTLFVSMPAVMYRGRSKLRSVQQVEIQNSIHALPSTVWVISTRWARSIMRCLNLAQTENISIGLVVTAIERDNFVRRALLRSTERAAFM